MEIISFYESGRQQHWLREIGRCGWTAGRFLHKLLSDNTFFETVGEGSELLMLTDGDELISFCTFAKRDEILTELSPWVGFVFTFPEHRGHRYFGQLLKRVQQLAESQSISEIYVSTDHVGLYEKYGFEYLTQMESIYGGLSRVYVKRIQEKGK